MSETCSTGPCIPQSSDQALRAATIARDALLQANVWNLMILQARTEDRPGEGLSIARSALASGRPRDPVVRALFHARAAHAYADQGEHGHARWSTGRAAEALAQAGDQERPSWLRFLDEAELVGLEACDRLALGRDAEAERLARDTLSALPENYSRNRTYYTITLAEAQVGMREVDAACATAMQALELAGTIRSGRVRSRLDGLQARLAAWDTPAVRDWQERYAEMTAEAV